MFRLSRKLFGELEKGNGIKYQSSCRITGEPRLGYWARTVQVSTVQLHVVYFEPDSRYLNEWFTPLSFSRSSVWISESFQSPLIFAPLSFNRSIVPINESFQPWLRFPPLSFNRLVFESLNHFGHGWDSFCSHSVGHCLNQWIISSTTAIHNSLM